MSLFLSVVPVKRAIEVAKSLATAPKTEYVPLTEAQERVLSGDIASDIDIPGFTRSVMDGYAVRAVDTAGAGESAPAILALKGRVLMGNSAEYTVQRGECAYVPTGGILPEGTDAVVMAENTEPFGDSILIKKTGSGRRKCHPL